MLLLALWDSKLTADMMVFLNYGRTRCVLLRLSGTFFGTGNMAKLCKQNLSLKFRS